jgi:predicted  nucleic acid-binding Zn-ribbon protein
MREIGVAVKCESCGRWFNATSQEQMDSKCPNCGGDFYLFKRQAALDDD